MQPSNYFLIFTGWFVLQLFPLYVGCNSLQSVLNDVSVVWRVFSLPVLEPMTRGRLEKIVAITMSCLHASLAATMATSVVAMTTGSTQLRTGAANKDEEIDGYASNIVKKSVLTLFVISCVVMLRHYLLLPSSRQHLVSMIGWT